MRRAYPEKDVLKGLICKKPPENGGSFYLVARRTRFELVTCGSVDRRSIHLSYRRLFKNGGG